MKRLVGWFLAVTLLSGYGWWLAKACAPNFAVAVFSYRRHPDLPRTLFVNGRLGVVQPTFARSYLIIAFRYLKGIGLSPGEREQARDYYDDRTGGYWDPIGIGWKETWDQHRRQIASPAPPAVSLLTNGQLRYSPDDHQFSLNCAEDAFRVAFHTLEARRAKFGISSPEFREWISGQDAVFANCDGTRPVIPAAVNPNLAPLLRADREYQIAAAHFYAGQLPAALEGFRRIGNDANSPWQPISRYLVLRTLLRMNDAGSSLKSEASRILDNPHLQAVHGITWNLVQRADIRDGDTDYFRTLAQLLSSRGQEDGLREELWNYTDLYDKVLGNAEPTSWSYDPHAPLPDASHFQGAELSDWLFTVQSHDPAAHTRSIALWRKTHSILWLLSTLMQANPSDAHIPGLLQAAAAVPPDSPAYLTAAFHLYRLQVAAGEKTAVIDSVDNLLGTPRLGNLPSSVNLFRGLRMMAAPNFNEFLTFALRKPVTLTFQLNTGETPSRDDSVWLAKYGPQEDRLDRDSVRILNRATPFHLLKDAALGEGLTGPARQEFLLTALTRGLMLNQDFTEIAKQLGDAALQGETTDEGKRFAAAFFLLHHPEARPYLAAGITRQTAQGKLDDYRDNWWCPMDIPMELNSRAEFEWDRAPAPVTAPFIGGSDRSLADQEFAQLGKLGNAADFLGGIVLAYAADHRDDPRVPEALHWVVTAGHLGCSDVNTWKTVRDAFRLLHRNYPTGRWAKRTPVWSQEVDVRQEIEWRRPKH